MKQAKNTQHSKSEVTTRSVGVQRLVIWLTYKLRQCSNLLWKLKMFFHVRAWDGQGKQFSGLKYWRDAIWRRDPDSRYCCDGYMCGCQAVTVREVFENHGEAI